jgi:NAD(P)-dependent dehydrogenase (short-subunit alcohol dehydrogenase family)
MTAKTMLITGGGRGIGAATARLAASQGYAVCVNYASNAAAAQALCASITASGGQAFAVQADVAHEVDVLRLFAAIDAQWGRLDVLVNNAGVLEQQMGLATMSAARLQRVFATNVIGTMLCAREAVKRMGNANSTNGKNVTNGKAGGAIVNVSSVAGRLGAPEQYVDYAASKGAVDSFTFGLAQEVAAQGIRVNAVAPGIIDTDIHASGGDPDRVARIAAGLPMQRAGTAQEVAQAILWLASDAASYVNGSVLDVGGGR